MVGTVTGWVRAALLCGGVWAAVPLGVSAQAWVEGAPDEDPVEGDATGGTAEGDAGDGGGAAPDGSLRWEAHASLGWYQDVGLGFRLDIPVIADGIVEQLDDDLRVSIGADVLWVYDSQNDGFGVLPVAALQWNFYLSPEWSVFPEVGAILIFSSHRDQMFGTFLAPFAAAGVRYHFGARNALVFRLGWPIGLQVGLTF